MSETKKPGGKGSNLEPGEETQNEDNLENKGH